MNLRIGIKIKDVLIKANIPNISNKVFPIVAQKEVKGDFIVFERTSLTLTKTNTSKVEEQNFSVKVVSDKYINAVNATEKAIASLVSLNRTSIDSQLLHIEVLGVDEGFEDPFYYQNINLKITIK